MPPELDQPSPAGVQFQPELCEPIAELSQEPLRIFLMLEASGKIVRALEAWEQYERASHDRKQVTFSRGLHRRYRLVEEESDDEIADRDMGGEDVIALPAETWQAIRDRAEQLLAAAEVDGLHGAVLWLTARRLAWSWATPAPRRELVQPRR